MVDVVSDQTEISYAESITGWSGDSFSLENEILVQGSNSVAVIQTNNGTNDVIFTIPTGSWDMSSSHLRLYMSSNIMPNAQTEANDGIQMFAGDGTNTAYWTVGGKDTYSGGWQDFFIDPNTTPTSGTVTKTAVTSVGIRINTASKPRNSTNGWYDNWRFGNGLEINSDTTEVIDFTDVAADDALVANKYDILEEIDGVLFGKGKLTLGNAASTKNCNLVSLNETIFFVDRSVSTTLYAIVGTEGTGATDIDITGLVCKTVGATGAELDFSAAVTSFSIDGSTFINMGTMSFNTGTVTNTNFNGCGTTSIASTQTFTGDTWIACDAIDLNNGGVLDGCGIDSTTAVAAVITDDFDDLIKCHFISDGSSHAVNIGNITTTQSMIWDNTEASYVTGVTGSPITAGTSGNETILCNVSSGQVFTINVADGASTPSVKNDGTGTVNVVAGQKAISFTVNPSFTGYEWRMYTVTAKGSLAGQTEVAGEEVATQDNQSYSYSYTADTPFAIQIISDDYEESVNYYDLINADQSVTINLKVDNND